MVKYLILITILFIIQTSPTLAHNSLRDATTGVNSIEEEVIKYSYSKLKHINSLLWLYETKMKKSPQSIEDIKEFVEEYDLDYDLENFKDCTFNIDDNDNSSNFTITLRSKSDSQIIIVDSLVIDYAKIKICFGQSLSPGSSIRSTHRELISGRIFNPNGETILLEKHKSRVGFIRADIDIVYKITREK